MSTEAIALLKILIVLRKMEEAGALQKELESLGHRVRCCDDVDRALELLQIWQPELVVIDESLGRMTNEGLRLAEWCRDAHDRINGWITATLVLIPVRDWDRMKRAQKTGAHVLVKGSNFGAAIRYIQTIADNLVTDRILGPVLVGIHRYSGISPHQTCRNCDWVGASVSYGSSQAEVVHLTPVRIALLNVLLSHRRTQSALTIADICFDSIFLQRVLRGHQFRNSALKMEISRLRCDISDALTSLGAPYSGTHFLPPSAHSTYKYGLAGNRYLIHVPSDASDLLNRKS